MVELKIFFFLKAYSFFCYYSQLIVNHVYTMPNKPKKNICDKSKAAMEVSPPMSIFAKETKISQYRL